MPKKPTKLHPADRRVRDLILWARAEGVVLARAHVADVEIEFTDTRIGSKSGHVPKSDAELTADLYRKYGGKAIEAFEAQRAPEVATADDNMLDAEDDAESRS